MISTYLGFKVSKLLLLLSSVLFDLLLCLAASVFDPLRAIYVSSDTTVHFEDIKSKLTFSRYESTISMICSIYEGIH